jgi:non-lysosomal glucosylceramidase
VSVPVERPAVPPGGSPSDPVESRGRGPGPESPAIPVDAWLRGIGVPCPDVGHPRVETPMIDDGEWAGVPIGGLGTGSIGRTYRGDFARWHLEVGKHLFRPSAVDGFTIHVGAADGQDAATTLLSAHRPTDLPASTAGLRPGQGTYHALFPRAWQTFEPVDLGVAVVGEQLSPVIGGDLETSALPVGVYDWWIENTAAEARTVGLLLTWEDPASHDGTRVPGGRHEAIATDRARGVVLHAGPMAPTGLQGTFAIAASDEPGLAIATRTGLDGPALAAVRTEFALDGRLAAVPPHPAMAGPGRDGQDGGPDAPASAGGRAAAISVTAALAPGERRSIRFALAWDLPMVEFGSGRRWWKRYTRTWGQTGGRAWDLATHALERADAWRAAIVAWQAPILDDPDRPGWYRAALFNELYFLVDGGTFWEAGEVGGPAPEPDDVGRFALIECIDYPFYDTVDVDFYASFAILETFPGLEARGIRDLLAVVPGGDPTVVTIEATGQRAIRKLPWAVPHDVGGPADDPFHRPNWYRFQDVNVWKDLAPKLVLQVWRDVVHLDDEGLIAEALPTLERVMALLAATDLDGDGLPDHGGIPDQTYDTWPMTGPSAYGGSLYLGALAAMEAMTRRVGDPTRADTYGLLRRRATESFERRLWRGSHYAYDDGGATSSESVMADQLAGQWYADATGLGDLVAPDRVRTALRTVHALNVVAFGDGLMGAVNGMRLDGQVDDSSEQSAEVWVGTTYALAAFMIGRGLLEEGWETARGAAVVTYERGLWFRTPEAYDRRGNFRASLYLRPLAIWAIEDALRRRGAPSAI